MTDTSPPSTVPPEDMLHTGAAGGRVIRGGMIRAGGFVVGIVFGLGTSALLLRHLGVEDYGKYGTVAALIGVAVLKERLRGIQYVGLVVIVVAIIGLSAS